MPANAKRSFWQRFRRPFRWCRIALWSFLLLLIGSFLYFNVIGLPDFLKSRLLAELRTRGIELEFSRLRWRWFQGLVAESVQVGGAGLAESPELSVAEVAVKLDPAELRRFRFKVTSLLLRDGRLIVPLSATNEPTQRFTVNNIMTELRLSPNDQWDLDQLQAVCLGARLNLSGSLTNASAIREWQTRIPTNDSPGLWRHHLRQALKIAKQVSFSQPPQINLKVRGDARDPASITTDLSLSAQDADTSWGKLKELLLVATLNRPSGSNNVGQSELKLQIDAARTPWIQAASSRFYVRWAQVFTNPVPTEVTWHWEFFDVDLPWGRIPEAHFSGRTFQSSTNPVLLKTDLMLDSGVFRSEWVDCRTNRLTAQLLHVTDGFLPVEADWQWTVAHPQSRWGSLDQFQLSGHLTRAPTNPPPMADESWAWWGALEPLQIDWSAQIDRVAVTNLIVDRISLNGRWRAPNLVIDKLHADLYDRQADATAQVNVGTRAVQSRVSFDFDVHRIERLLPANSQRWLSQYTWEEPPKVNAEATLTLAAWTNSGPNWGGEVLPTVGLSGELEGRDAAFRGVPVSHAQSHFSYSNFVWHLPDFVAAGPEGRVEFDHTSDNRTRDYHFTVRSRIDPQVLKPLFEEKGSKALDYFQFTEPPLVEGEVRGRWREPDLTGVQARVNATNFKFRGEPVSELTTQVQYTNRYLTATEPKIRSGEETVSASAVGFDASTLTLFLTNAVSAMDPQRITRAIGPRVAKSLSPYVFKTPPAARVNGFVEVRRGKQANLKFDLSGGPFSFWKFNLPQISGTVLWQDETVTITNVTAGFYNGKLDGDLSLDFSADDNAEFRLSGRVTDSDLHLLMSDVSSPTNKLEGMLSGNLTLTRANAGDWKSWNGFGNVHLRDGFLWGIPVFGIFSDVLEAVIPIPGVGNSRVSGGTATFIITNSVIHTDDMEIRSPAMRLAYRGTIDFEGHVDARVEARILRDAWVVGPLVSLVFSPLTKLFEYKVTGTLHEPKKEPLFIPKELFFPFHPLKTLRELFSPEKPTPAQPESEKPTAPQR